MILTMEDIGAIKVAFAPHPAQIDQNVAEPAHKFGLHFEHTDQQVAGFGDKFNLSFKQIDQQIGDLAHKSNTRLTAIALRLDSIGYKLSQIAVFVPFENAFLVLSSKRQQNRDWL